MADDHAQLLPLFVLGYSITFGCRSKSWWDLFRKTSNTCCSSLASATHPLPIWMMSWLIRSSRKLEPSPRYYGFPQMRNWWRSTSECTVTPRVSSGFDPASVAWWRTSPWQFDGKAWTVSSNHYAPMYITLQSNHHHHHGPLSVPSCRTMILWRCGRCWEKKFWTLSREIFGIQSSTPY